MEPEWSYIGSGMEAPMGVNLSIKNVPEDVVERVRALAKRNHRSLQGELMSMLEDLVREDDAARRLSAREIFEMNRRDGWTTAGDSTQIVRDMRDDRY
jgi:plasmid stability protein